MNSVSWWEHFCLRLLGKSQGVTPQTLKRTALCESPHSWRKGIFDFVFPPAAATGFIYWTAISSYQDVDILASPRVIHVLLGWSLSANVRLRVYSSMVGIRMLGNPYTKCTLSTKQFVWNNLTKEGEDKQCWISSLWKRVDWPTGTCYIAQGILPNILW